MNIKKHFQNKSSKYKNIKMLQRSIAVSNGLNTLSDRNVYLPRNVEKRQVQKMNTQPKQEPYYYVENRKKRLFSFIHGTKKNRKNSEVNNRTNEKMKK